LAIFERSIFEHSMCGRASNDGPFEQFRAARNLATKLGLVIRNATELARILGK